MIFPHLERVCLHALRVWQPIDNGPRVPPSYRPIELPWTEDHSSILWRRRILRVGGELVHQNGALRWT